MGRLDKLKLECLRCIIRDTIEKLVSMLEDHTSECGRVPAGNQRLRPDIMTEDGTHSNLSFKPAEDKHCTWMEGRLDGSNMTTLTTTGRDTSELVMPLT